MSQLAPLLVLLNRPPAVPAQMTLALLGSIARHWTVALPKPVLISFQLAPWLALLKTPPTVPAKRIESGLIARPCVLGSPVLKGLQLAPPSVLLNTPS